MNFDLTKASDKLVGSGKVYQKPGIYENVVIDTISNGESKSGKKYIQMTTVGEKGELGRSPQMYLTDAAWPMTARNFTDLLISTHNCTEDEAKAMIKVENETQLAAKLSALLIGRKFRAKFKGEESSTGTIFAQLGGSESMQVPASDTRLFFNEVKDIKKYEGTLQTAQPTFADSKDDTSLPF
jgi:hypothetical protein